MERDAGSGIPGGWGGSFHGESHDLGKIPGGESLLEFGQLHIQDQRQILSEVCEQLLYGYSRPDATEHGDSNCIRTSKDIAKLILSISKVLDYRARFHNVDEILSEAQVGETYVGWMHEWLRS